MSHVGEEWQEKYVQKDKENMKLLETLSGLQQEMAEQMKEYNNAHGKIWWERWELEAWR